VRLCHSNSFNTTGKYWVEATFDETLNRNTTFGIVTAEVSLIIETGGIGNISSAAGTQVGIARPGVVHFTHEAEGTEEYPGPVTNIGEGDVLNLSIDLDIGLIGFYINGEFQAAVSIPTGLEYYVALGVSRGGQVTVNLHQDVVFTHLPPTAGYTDWDGNAIGVITPPSNNLAIEVY